MFQAKQQRNSVQTEALATQRPTPRARLAPSHTPHDNAQPAFPQVLRECFRNESCVALDESLALSGVLFPSLSGSLIILTSEG